MGSKSSLHASTRIWTVRKRIGEALILTNPRAFSIRSLGDFIIINLQPASVGARNRVPAAATVKICDHLATMKI